MFPPNMMPGDPLQEQYSAWLSEEPAEGAASLCGAHSLGNEIDFDELMASTEVLTDDDLAQLGLVKPADYAQVVEELEHRTQLDFKLQPSVGQAARGRDLGDLLQ